MERVYHYTSMKALLGIFESVKKSSNKKSFVFMATNIFYMNDPKEFIYGQKVLMDTLRKIEIAKNVNDNLCLSSFFYKYPQKSEEEWLVLLRDAISEKKMAPFIISFSRNEDSLPMWLNYGDGGKGVCLAFAEYRNHFDVIRDHQLDIDNLVVDIYDSLGAYDVQYKFYDITDSPLRKSLDSMYDYYIEKSRKINQVDLYRLQIEMLRALTIVHAPYIKTNDFEGESEVRMVKTIISDKREEPYEIQFRTNLKGNIIPYIEVEIPIKQLDYVIVGPLANQELSIKAIEMIKAKYNFEFDIIKSKIQYRDY